MLVRQNQILSVQRKGKGKELGRHQKGKNRAVLCQAYGKVVANLQPIHQNTNFL